MRHRLKFRIPVGWEEGDLVETLPSDSEIVGWPLGDFPSEIDVLRLKRAWSPHIPEKKPRYVGQYDGREVELEGPLRLDQMRIGGRILVRRPVHRLQRCFEFKGLRHVIFRVNFGSVATLCGLSEYITDLRARRIEFFPEGATGVEPTCRDCLLKGREVWIPYIVFPYVHPRAHEKDEHKVRAKVKAHAKQPTAFERILLDDVLDPPLKPKAEPLPPPEDEFTDPREMKLASQRASAERFRRSKATRRR